jgi:hypothetical protein
MRVNPSQYIIEDKTLTTYKSKKVNPSQYILKVGVNPHIISMKVNPSQYINEGKPLTIYK